MSSLFGGKQQQQQLPPPLPTPPPVDTSAPEVQGAGAEALRRLRGRKGRESTILTGGSLITPETSGGPGSLLGGGARR